MLPHRFLKVWVLEIELRSSCLQHNHFTELAHLRSLIFNISDEVSYNSGWPQAFCVAENVLELPTMLLSAGITCMCHCAWFIHYWDQTQGYMHALEAVSR